MTALMDRKPLRVLEPKKGQPSGWDEARVERANSLYLAGLGPAEIARKLTSGAFQPTRNAVIGALRRRGGLVRDPTTEAGWTQARIDKAHAMYLDGKPGPEIAQALTEGDFRPTRAAVIAKLHRLGLTVQRSEDMGRTVRVQAAVQGAQRKAAVRAAQARAAAPAAVPAPTPPKPASAAPIAFMDHERWQCPWPLSTKFADADAEMLVCGDRRFPGERYCEAHCRDAFRNWGS